MGEEAVCEILADLGFDTGDFDIVAVAIGEERSVAPAAEAGEQGGRGRVLLDEVLVLVVEQRQASRQVAGGIVRADFETIAGLGVEGGIADNSVTGA